MLSYTRLLRQLALPRVTRNMCSKKFESKYGYETVAVSLQSEFVAHVELNRPKKGNAMNKAFWREISECFDQLSRDEDVRSVVISGRGKIFTGGLDLASLTETPEFFDSSIEVSRRARRLNTMINDYQQSFNSIEECKKPVIAAVHSACVGGGVDMVTACDIRYCTEDSYFCVKEADLGLAADVGTLQRLPKIVGNDSWVREICYTARTVPCREAALVGLVSRVLPDRESLLTAAFETAQLIAQKSPVAVQVTKEALVYARDHTVPESLYQMQLLNQLHLQSEDLTKCAESFMTNKKPVFSKL